MNLLEMIKNEKVEWRKLGEVCEDKFWIMPKTPEFNEEYTIPYITGKNIKNWEINFDNVSYISEEDYNRMCSGRKILKNDILISMIGTIGKIACVNTDVKFYGQNLYLIRLNNKIILNRFFYHFFSQSDIQNSLISKKNTSSQGYIKAGQIENILIPIPSLETQEKIVKTLDKFTKYVTELQAELRNRTKQYSYYRNMLLSEQYLSRYFDKNNVLEVKTIAEACYIENSARKAVAADLREKGEIAYYGANNIQDYVKGYTHNGEYILIAEDGSRDLDDYSIQYIVGKFWANNHVHVVRAKEGLLNRYLYYFLKETNFKPYLSSLTRSKLTKENLMKINIKVPPLNIQQIVVNILDKYRELLSDTNGLPREIELRKKQYEYYREKLLDFKGNQL